VANKAATAPTTPIRVHPPGRSHVKRIIPDMAKPRFANPSPVTIFP
jgi:hypothetical protein